MDNSKSTSTTMDRTGEMIVYLIFIIVLGATLLPGVLFALLFSLIFINIKFPGVIFAGIGVITCVYINFNICSLDNFLMQILNLMKNVITAFMQHNTQFGEIYINYLQTTSYAWQIAVGIIFAGIIAQVYFSKHKVLGNVPKTDVKARKKAEKIVDMEHPIDSTIIGADVSGGTIQLEDKAKHIIVAGTTGSGKTVTIANILQSAFQKNIPTLAIDGKGDLDSGSLLHYMQEFSEKYKRKLYVINLTKPECSDKYNPFRNAGRTEAKDMLISMSDWTEPHYKVNTERYLQQLIKILNIANSPLSLNTIINYNAENFKNLLEKLKDDEKIDIEEYTKSMDIIETTKDIAASAMARFATTAESEAGEIFSYSDGIDIYTAIKENANILIILDSLGKPELSKQVGRLAVIDAKKAVSKLFTEKTRKFFVFDEFNVYASDVAVDLLNKSRTANITCTVAFQSLSDLDKAGGAALRNQVIENCNNYFIMRQNSPDSSFEWEKVIGEKDTFKFTHTFKEDDSVLGKIFGDGKQETGGGSMYQAKESKFRASEIQSLKTGQAIFVSKDQVLEKKIQVRCIKLETEHPELREIPKKVNNIDEIKKEVIKEEIQNNKEPNIDKEEVINGEIKNSEFDDIEKFLND